MFSFLINCFRGSFGFIDRIVGSPDWDIIVLIIECLCVLGSIPFVIWSIVLLFKKSKTRKRIILYSFAIVVFQMSVSFIIATSLFTIFAICVKECDCTIPLIVFSLIGVILSFVIILRMIIRKTEKLCY